MPLQTDEIRTVLEQKGLLKFGTMLLYHAKNITEGVKDAVVDNNYTKMELEVDSGSNTITLTRVPNDSPVNNAVNIQTIDAYATIGKIRTPGYVYTGDFSGCVFYLYKTGPGEVTGVHAYSGSQPVETRVGFFRKKKINMVVREFGPTDYFTRNPATQICRYPTRGEIDIMGGEMSLAFLSCVERTSATTFLFSVVNSKEGARVRRLLRTYEANF
jgi:hypothetical protein